MTPTLGKRKRLALGLAREAREVSVDSSDGLHDAQAIFKRHFESRFKPLPPPKKAAKIVEKALEPQDDDTEWDGISEPDGMAAI
jgi:hypothetical protein